MPSKRQVYLLDPRRMKPEVIAVTFAKTSRSPQSFQEIAEELSEEKSAEFNEKWVVGYGHASVAEHAVLHIAVENISRLAVETLESNRLASYTEKSSRYQKWGSDEFFVPVEANDAALLPMYMNTCRLLFDTYQQAIPAVRAVIAAQNPRQEGESESAWERRIRADYIDVCRFLLPAAALANVGMTINARSLEYAITKMLSHPLMEVNAIGQEIKAVAQQEVPTLVKYADESPYLIESRQVLTSLASRVVLESPASADWCQLTRFDHQAEEQILASALFRFGYLSFSQALAYVQSLSLTDKQRLGQYLIGNATRHQQPIRELEHATYTFELTLDQGAYFELKRHRMMTITPQPLNTLLGYAVPRAMVEAGMESAYRQAMEVANQTYGMITRFNPEMASYIVPNGYNRRVLMTMNLRNADHFCALRSAPNAHFSMRRVAQRVAEEIKQASPLLGQFLHLCADETWQEIESQYFAQTA